MIAGIHVLVVEAHEPSRVELEQALRSSGALVVAAGSAQAALEFCAEIRFDVIITNLALPSDDGASLAGELRARGQHMPIVVVSDAPHERVEHLLGGTFTRWLRKPVDARQLIDVVASVVG
jgi:CheY-like chemotaxis protein